MPTANIFSVVAVATPTSKIFSGALYISSFVQQRHHCDFPV
ncbi:MAG: hypothetical protein ABSH39_22025 [Candidatus Acidiferrum sp.]|jgi:hypothetical protein